jgi:hypothetical protein
MNMNFITTYHPKSDGQIERVNKVIEDMLRMYIFILSPERGNTCSSKCKKGNACNSKNKSVNLGTCG